MLYLPENEPKLKGHTYKNPLNASKGVFFAPQKMTVRLTVFASLALAFILLSAWSYFWELAIWGLVPVSALLLLGLYDLFQTKKTVLRVYPVIGHLRYFFESIRPEIQQYFVESDTNGTPVSREFRALVYQRAKQERDTRPFGTLFDVYKDGYEWVNHSMRPMDIQNHNPRVVFGGSNCSQPYAASMLNISAMSYGALSKNAIMALNKGAKMGGFAHNTGEGGISPYHAKHGGDLIWQIGTGYFGCRSANGNFDAELFQSKASRDQVKMIELKISQGAKPGLGGMLPGAKVTEEIAEIRGVPVGKDIISPSRHSEFSTPIELLQFIAKLRELSGGKPVGFKLCVGNKTEFLAICKAMVETNITPDFITVDGSEGGTGAAPVEMTNSVGTPLREGLVFVHNALTGVGLRGQIRIVASGKAFSAFHILRLLALGADTVNSARAMMMALGCIQARSCHNDNCPTGIATQKASRFNSLDVESKSERVKNYHTASIKHLLKLTSSAGLSCPSEIEPEHLFHRVAGSETKNYAEIYDFINNKVLVNNNVPLPWQNMWQRADANNWVRP